MSLGPRLDELAARYGLPGEAARRLEAVARALIDDPLAPTAIQGPARVLDDHLADSLVALELEPVRSAGTVADIGSGAGLPGLPLALARPEARFVLIESAGRKCEFMRRAALACGAQNVEIVHARAEELPGRGYRFDLVTARALASLAVVAEYAAPLLRVGGTVVAWRGRRDAQAELEAERAAAELGLEVGEVLAVSPYKQAEQRNLHLMSKVRETPERFPRRPGVALKRPLGRTALDRPSVG